MKEIRNKVAESGLINLDLARFKPDPAMIAELDIASQLWQGLVLKEKDFRQFVSAHDWGAYIGKSVYVHCSADAIVPTWAYMLVASALQLAGVDFVTGSRDELERELIRRKIAELELEPFVDGRLIIKGCSDIASPEFAMTELIRRLQPVSKSILYGEPCSTVPVFKRKNV